VGLAGSASYDASTGTYTLGGAGADIWNTADGFQFAFATLTGDGSYVARVASMANFANYGKAGIMMRSSLDPGSAYAIAFLTPQGTVNFEQRSSSGASSTAVASKGTFSAPVWLKLTRTGNSFAVYYGTNGTTWTQLGATATIPMGSTVYAGMIASSHSSSQLATATFTSPGLTPAVTSFTVNDGSAQRSTVSGLAVTFNQPVTLDVGAFSVVGRNGAGSGTSVSWTNPTGDGQTWLVTFSGPGVTAAGLGDGVYDFKVTASAVHPVGAAPGSPAYSMAADYATSFFRLFGDSDGNGTVNALDYARFKAAFGSAAGSPGYNGAFDFDGNGAVNALDYAYFKNNFGKTVGP
jgi:regulation of enolase protein 1 (concanavalin A-like superfamily)